MIDHDVAAPDDLADIARPRLSGVVPSLSFTVEYEGRAQLVPIAYSESEEIRLRAFISDHASEIGEAFIDLLERWCER